jgi:predicted dehydrogenase/nucleoside-diphosphate-sugar epimerase
VRLLITGAAGFIGRRLTAAALLAGHEVHTLARREWDGWPAVASENRFLGRLPFAWPSAAFEGVAAVIHCAVDTTADLDPARAVNVVGTVRLAEGARRVGASFVFLSSQSAHPGASTAYGKTKYEAEQLLLGMEGLDLVIVRPGLVCGPGGIFGRVAASARRLPIVPVFNASAVVQPIFVGDLVDALLRVAGDTQAGGASPIAIAHRIPQRLGSMIEAMASEYGKSTVRVPDAPVRAAVSVLESVGIRLPLRTDNLRVMQKVVPLDSIETLDLLGVPDRSMIEIVKLALSEEPPDDPPRDRRASRFVLVGAGRIGLVHAVTLTGLPGAVLSAIVDRDPRQLRVLRSLGVQARAAKSFEAALDRADAAVIATPPSSHLALARTALARGRDVLIEKPAVSRVGDLDEFIRVAHDAGDARVFVGYVMLAMPHIRDALSRLRRGDYGRPISFTGLTAISLIEASSPKRWETDQDVSGGGVVANSSPHVLSMIVSAFGPSSSTRTELARLVSVAVEDSAVVRFTYPQVSGTHYSSWCIPGYERQENRLSIATDRGELVITTALASFQPHDGAIQVLHQLDYDTGFNIAPDYSGGGIAAELTSLTRRHGGAAASADEAAAIERQLFALYEDAKTVARFTGRDAANTRPAAASTVKGRRDLVVDLRAASLIGTPAEEVPWDASWPAAEVDLVALPRVLDKIDSTRLRVTVPSFLPKARLLSERRYATVVKEMGARGFIAAGLRAASVLPSERGLTFWTAAVALVAAELAQLPGGYKGTVMLHPYITDLAIALERYDQLDRLMRLLGSSRRPIGMHSNLAKLAGNSLALIPTTPNVLSVLTTTGPASALAGVRADMASIERLRGVHLTAEVGPAPTFVHEAVASGQLALTGADSVLVSAVAKPAVRHVVEQSVRVRWDMAFPGTELPEIVLR